MRLDSDAARGSRGAARVAQTAADEGVATRVLQHPVQDIYDLMWRPDYPQVEAVARIAEKSTRDTEPSADEPG